MTSRGVATVKTFVGMFRDAGQRWAADADRLDQWATEQEIELGGRKIMLTERARFRAAALRLGAACLGAGYREDR